MGVSEPLAQQALIDSAIAFCDQSLAVTVTLSPITVPVGISSIELDTPDNTSVAQILYVWYDKRLMSPVPYGQMTDIYRQDGTPTDYTIEYIDEVANLMVYPAPNERVTNGLVVRCALRPSRDATEVHDILYHRYADGIIYGAQSILFSMPDQPWTDVGRAQQCGVTARARANQARADMLFGRVQSSMTVQMREF
ncbi:hypothetical protein EBU58_04925 [bacterium]|nr:hypothetical protein [bacterium]